MNRFLGTVLLSAVAGALLCCGCSDKQEIEQIQTPPDPAPDQWDANDFDRYEVVFRVCDTAGKDLLAQDNPCNITNDRISVSFRNGTYPLTDAAEPSDGEPMLRLVKDPDDSGYALRFGRFSPADDYRSETFTLDWGDGRTTEVEFSLYAERQEGVIVVCSPIRIDGELTDGSYGAGWEHTFRLAARTYPDASYESSDFSADGKVTLLQQASEGNGIDIVILGDGYSDRLIDNGFYMVMMRKAMEAVFSEEPIRSFRHLFNVYAVTAVSRNEVVGGSASTALSCKFGDGTLIEGDDNACIRYAWGVPELYNNMARMNELVIVAVVNQIRWAGTCYPYGPYSLSDGRTLLPGDYGRGFAVTYSAYHDEADLIYTVTHEAVGHGFAKLADEYYSVGTTIPESEREFELWLQNFGYWRNVDFSGDETGCAWYKYMTDPRYDGADLGYFQGADYWEYGVWRSSQRSLMYYTEGGFNPISRESMYRRIHKLAYGDSWEFDYETFVAFDAVCRTDYARKAVGRCVLAPRPMLPQPVMIDRSRVNLEALGL